MRPSRWYRSALSCVVTAAVVTTGLALAPGAAAAPFTEGNVVVLRVGSGDAALAGTATPVFLDEFTPGGSLVATTALPTSAADALTLQGTSTSEGGLSRSQDGRHLLLAGYRAEPGVAAGSSSRVVGRIDADGVADTTTVTSVTTGSPRSVVSEDGSRYWLSGAAGVHTGVVGTSGTTSVASANLRQSAVAGGDLFTTSTNGGFQQVGDGLPTEAGTTVAPLATVANATSVVVLDVDPAVPGPDTAYVAQDQGSAGMTKLSSDGTTWTARGTVLADPTRAVTGSVTAQGTVRLFATTTASRLVAITDTAASSAAPQATTTELVGAPLNTAFRGVALAPVGGTPVVEPPSITTQPASTSVRENETATLRVTASGTAPLAYQWFEGTAPDTSTPVGTSSASFTTPALTASTSYWVRVTNAAGSADSATAQVAVDASPLCSAPDVLVGSVQGTGETTPLAGQAVTVQGTVVGDYEGATPGLRGFYLQGEPDGDEATSDALFVFNNLGGTSPDLVSLGDVVQVTGTAGENQGQTQVTASRIEACGTTGTVAPTAIGLPLAGPTALEAVEGMLVTLDQTVTVTEHFQLGRFGQVVVSDGRLRQPTNIYPADDPRSAELAAANQLNRLIVDDASQAQNPDPIVFGRGGQPLSAQNTLRAGDTLTDAVGVLTYTWAGNAASGNAYRLRPVGALGGSAQFTAANERPTGTPDVGGTVRVAGANLLNFFNTFTGCTFGVGGAAADCRGAGSELEYERQLAKHVAALRSLDADVIGVNEIENDGYGADSALQSLVAALDAEDGAGTWAYVDPDAATGRTNSAGTDAIKVALLYRTAAVTAVPGRTFAYEDLAGIFDRTPVAQTFARPDGSLVTVAVNHFKSKGSCPAAGDPDADQGDGQSCWNARRTTQATTLAAWLDETVVPAAGSADVLLVGDLNSYAKEDPILALEAAGYVNLVERFGGQDAYSYGFDGQWGYLDHALASASLAPRVTGTDEVHINADEPSVLDYNVDFKTPGQVESLYAPDRFRTSDHDPVLVGLDLRRTASSTTVTSSAPWALHRGSVRWTAAVGVDGGAATGGTVQFLLGETPLGAPVPVVDGRATSPTVSDLPPGLTTVTAVYSGSPTVAGSTGTYAQAVRFVVVPVTPASGSSVNRGAVVPLTFRLRDARGVVPDALAARWLGECRVAVAVTGAQTLARTCELAYDRRTDLFSYRWETNRRGGRGTVTATMTATYPGLSAPTTATRTFRIR